MDVQLQELIDKIKKDGVASAETSANEIISNAEKQAKQIIADAESKAESIVSAAKSETARMEKASEDAIKQAARNIILSFRDSVTKELTALVASESEKAYSKDMLEKLIPDVVKAWAKDTDAKDVSVLLSEKDLANMEKNLRAALKAEIEKGLTLKVDKTLANGFRIGVKDGQAFYDFSADALSDLFASYLNPRTAALMKEAAN